MIESISIRNYRGIENLKLNNFKKYNFFVGDNGSCKTAVIESIFSALPKFATGIIECANSRGMKVTPKNISSVFFGADVNRKIEFILNDKIKTTIEKKENYSVENKKIIDNIFNVSNEVNQEEVLYNVKEFFMEEKYFDIDILSEKDNLKSLLKNMSSKYNEIAIEEAAFVSDLTKYQKESAEIMKELIENKKKNEILDMLNIFEPDIDEVFSDGTEILLGKKNIEKLIPLSSFGNGLSAFIEIMVCFIAGPRKAIFIDEIETGIHYLNFSKLVEVLVKLSIEKDIQLFITTHSKEFLKEFYEYLEDSKEDICLYRFQKIKNKLKEVYYPKERVITAMQNGWDIR